MPEDEAKLKKPGLDPDARVVLGRQLRDYYERMRQIPVSDSLARLLTQFEKASAAGSEQPDAAG